MRNAPILFAAIALLFGPFSQAGFCNDGLQLELHQPTSIQTVAHDAELYRVVSAEEAASLPEAPAGSACCESAPPACGVCDASCGRQSCGCGCCRKPWTLPQPCFLKKRGVMIGGWIEQGITFNGNNPADKFAGPIGTNDLDGEYQMNQLWLYAVKPVNTGGRGWDIGGRFDILFGSDWRFGINQGLEDRINGFNRQTYGTVIPQAYVEVGVNNLSVKLGHMAGILDYEVVPAVPNPFYSHSYCYSFTVPQLVTGVMADYKLTERFSVQAGFTRGWMKFEDNNHHMDFMGGVKWVSCDKRTSIAYALNMGPQDDAGQHDRYSGSLVLQHQLTKKLRYVLVQNAGVEFGGASAGTADAEWYGVNQYFLYQINPCWAFNTRVEWLRDDDGTRVGGPPPQAGIRAWPLSGFAGNFYELTLGFRWTPRKNIIVRPELRWDWYDGLTNADGKMPFNDGNSENQVLVGTDVIVTF